jgi:hypothetical protein
MTRHEGASNWALIHHPAMKKTFTFLAVACAMTLLPMSNANAGHGSTCRLTGHTPCGKPIYSHFHVHGYDSCGRPVGHWVQQYPSSCRCRSQHGHGGYNHGHSSIHSHDGRRSGWNFFFRF